VFGKPGSHKQAVEQLQEMRGQVLIFHTGLCLLNSQTGSEQIECVEFKVHFRQYSEEEIERYLQAEQPYDCAASFKSECLGISMVQSIQGPDPTALVGLPLIKLSEMLRLEGVNTP
jgi:septum formation protein